ncbi:Trp biosynthesis-associated membrane protein [Actinopolymorpha cephalotaxi]|uniref:Trp biosynthesis-associated membrane protein n=1 Tax=Actinopolymorpha cephalotaxi TaxID=504797 RepID=UPI0015CCB2A9
MNPTTPAPSASPKQAARRQFFVALALVLGGAALVLWAAGRTWLAARWAIPNYPAVHTSVTGAQAAPLARSAGFLGLAGVLAVLATRGRGRQVAGGLVALAGVAAVASAVTFWTRAGAVAEAAVRRAIAGGAGTGGGGSDGATTATVQAWPWLAVAGGLLVVAGGVLAIARGRTWPAMGSRYDAPAARRTNDDPWAALDRGEDPTDPADPPSPTNPTQRD